MKWKQLGRTSTTPPSTTAMRGDQQPMVDDNEYNFESPLYTQFSWNKNPSTLIPFHYVHIHHHGGLFTLLILLFIIFNHSLNKIEHHANPKHFQLNLHKTGDDYNNG